MRRITRMMIFWAAVVLFAGSAVTAPKTHIAPFDPSLRLPKPCKAEAEKVQGIWYVNVQREFDSPDEAAKFASGAFDAEIPVWVHFKKGQQLVTVTVGANEDGARVDSGSVFSTGHISGASIVGVENPTRCAAFAPASP